ncbi:MAG TPA: PD-(D/E)XK nuclease family protein, partial [Acidimicrobiia bacterium]
DARRHAQLDAAEHPALDALPVVARGFAMVAARAADVYGEYDGVVGPLDGLRTGGALSATALERWATCSFAYFLERVLHINVVERPERIDELTAIDRGVLLHRIFDRFVREAPRPASPTEPWSLEARALLARITAECCDDAERRGITGNALVWRQRRRRVEQVAAAFCPTDDRWRGELGVVPWRSELDFGFDDQVPPLALTLDGVGEVHFRGRIDRIDRAPQGDALVVTDYKSGRLPDRRSGGVFDPVAGGRVLQLAIYGMVAERLEPGADVSAYLRWVSNPVEDPEPPFANFDVTRQRLHQVVQGIVAGIDGGVFPADPGPSSYDVGRRRDTFENCRHCPFDRLCPTDRGEAHARKLHDPQLAPLHGLECTEEDLEALMDQSEAP